MKEVHNLCSGTCCVDAAFFLEPKTDTWCVLRLCAELWAVCRFDVHQSLESGNLLAPCQGSLATSFSLALPFASFGRGRGRECQLCWGWVGELPSSVPFSSWQPGSHRSFQLSNLLLELELWSCCNFLSLSESSTLSIFRKFRKFSSR